MKSKLKLKWKNAVENVCPQFLWMRNLLYIFGQLFWVMHGNGGDGYRLIVHTVGHEEGASQVAKL